MLDSWQNLISTISNATPIDKLCFKGVSNSLLNEEIPRKSMEEEMPNTEALTISYGLRQPYRRNSRPSISRVRSTSR